MDKKIIEISNDGLFLSTKRGFLCIEDKEQNVSHDIPLNEILSLIVSSS